MHGRIKNRPGPLAPPGKILPKRRITARSYSFTICFNLIWNEFFFIKLNKNFNKLILAKKCQQIFKLFSTCP